MFMNVKYCSITCAAGIEDYIFYHMSVPINCIKFYINLVYELTEFKEFAVPKTPRIDRETQAPLSYG